MGRVTAYSDERCERGRHRICNQRTLYWLQALSAQSHVYSPKPATRGHRMHGLLMLEVGYKASFFLGF